MAKVLFFANTDWYFYNFRLSLACAAQAQGHEVVVVVPAGPYVARIEATGCRCVTLPFSRFGMNLWREAKTLLALWSIFRTERPDLVHSFTLKCVLYGTLLNWLCGVRHIVNSVTGTGYLLKDKSRLSPLARSLFLLLGKLCFNRCRVHFIFQNTADRAAFIDLGLTVAERAVLIKGSGVDENIFVEQPPVPGLPVVLLPARLLWGKGVGDFVEAARLLIQRGVGASFVLVGDVDADDAGSIPPSLLAEWVRQGWVEWWGKREDMPAVLAQATIVCLPTYYGEGVPKSLIEAAACGRPIVASDEPGCREIVRDGDNGLIVPAQQPILLAEALHRLLVDGELRQRLGRAGRQLVIDEFSVRIVNEQTLRLYALLFAAHQSIGEPPAA